MASDPSVLRRRSLDGGGERAIDSLEQLLLIERLGEERCRTGLHRPFGQRNVAVSGNEDHGQLRFRRAEHVEEIEPGLARLMRDYAHTEAQVIADWVAERSEVPVNLEVVKGSPSWELTSRAKKADLVVLGSSTVDAFAAGLTRLETLAADRPTAFMCAERDLRQCHRRFIAQALLSRGWQVQHLIAPGEAYMAAPEPLQLPFDMP